LLPGAGDAKTVDDCAPRLAIAAAGKRVRELARRSNVRARELRVDDVLAIVAIEAAADHRVGTSSTGMRQRLPSIAAGDEDRRRDCPVPVGASRGPFVMLQTLRVVRERRGYMLFQPTRDLEDACAAGSIT
jgi:hypothetical protein